MGEILAKVGSKWEYMFSSGAPSATKDRRGPPCQGWSLTALHALPQKVVVDLKWRARMGCERSKKTGA